VIGLSELFSSSSSMLALEAESSVRRLQVSKATTINVIEDHLEVAQRIRRLLSMRFMDGW